MPSTSTDSSGIGLWARVLAACALLAAVALALVAAEALIFGVVTFGALVVLAGVGAWAVGDPALGLVLAVVAYAVLAFVVLAAYHAAGEDGRGFEAAPDLLGYVYAMLILASLAVTYWAFTWLGLPGWTILVVGLTVIAMAYPMALYQAAGGLSGDDGDGGDDDTPPWAVEEIERQETSTRETLRTVGAEMRRLLGEAVARLGLPGTALALAAAAGALGAVYAAAAARSASAMHVPVAAGLTLLVVGVHVADVVRTELTDAAVLRELDDRFGVASDREGSDVEALGSRIERLAAQAGVPAPDVRLVSSLAPAAAAVGYRPSASTVVVSPGLVDALDDRELDAVLAHELAHVANRDAAVLTALSFPRAGAHRAFDRYGLNPVVALFAGAVALTSRFCTAVVARARECAADDAAVAVTGDPAALASALETLDAEVSRRPRTDLRSAAAFSIVPPPWEEHPFFDRTRRLVYRGLLGTHPPTEARVERLRSRSRALETRSQNSNAP